MVLYPNKPITKPDKDKNPDSIVMMMTYKDISFMFTGDTVKRIEKSLLDSGLKSTVLKVAHHGANTSTDPAFLSKVAPSYAVISSNDQDGKGKTYGHPHKETLTSLKDNHIKLYRTDLSDTIVMKTDGKKNRRYSGKRGIAKLA